MAGRTRTDDLAIEIAAMLATYTDDVSSGIKEAAVKVANETVKNLKRDSPKDSGKYAKGWNVKIDEDSRRKIGIVVHNKQGALTHLLEKGHELRQGGRSPTIVHIKPNEERAIAEFDRECREVIERAGR